MRLGDSQVHFLSRLGKSPDGQQLLALIQAEIAESNSMLRKLDGKDLLREQGKAIFLDIFVSRLTQQPASAPTQPKRTPSFAGGMV